jgi:hypothetical protein
MNPGALHPIEPVARRLALRLFGMVDAEQRFDVTAAVLRPIAAEMLDNGATAADVDEHCTGIMARAEVIERMGHPAPVRERIPGLGEFLEQAQERIADLMR